jgi:hypothetical protein
MHEVRTGEVLSRALRPLEDLAAVAIRLRHKGQLFLAT